MAKAQLPEREMSVPTAEREREIHVDVRRKALLVVKGRRILKTYPIGVGSKEWPTPHGEFLVEDVQEKPPATFGAGRIVLAKDFSIHGAMEEPAKPKEIRLQTSERNILLSNKHLKELLKFVSPGTYVKVEPSISRFAGYEVPFKLGKKLKKLPLTAGLFLALALAPKAIGGEAKGLARIWALNSPPAYVQSIAEGRKGTHVVLNIPSKTLCLYEGASLMGVFPIAIGTKEYATATGDYKVRKIIWNPKWVIPKTPWGKKTAKTFGGRWVIPSWDKEPRNPLGKAAIDLVSAGGRMATFHGTSKAEVIGQYATHGCVRVPDIEALAKSMARGMPVKIVYNTVGVHKFPGLEQVAITVYPDEYGRGTNSLKRFRQELESVGVVPEKIGWDKLIPVLEGASGTPYVFPYKFKEVSR